MKHLVAVNANYCCAKCGCNTRGSRENLAHCGSAAHIYPASSNGPRFDASISDDFIYSARNALWLCLNCHAEVDANPTVFTVNKLLDMKSQAESNSEIKLNPMLSALALRDVHVLRMRAELIDSDNETFSMSSFNQVMSIVIASHQYEKEVHLQLFKALTSLVSNHARGPATGAIPQKTLHHLLDMMFDYYPVAEYFSELYQLSQSIAMPAFGFVRPLRLFVDCAIGEARLLEELAVRIYERGERVDDFYHETGTGDVMTARKAFDAIVSADLSTLCSMQPPDQLRADYAWSVAQEEVAINVWEQMPECWHYCCSPLCAAFQLKSPLALVLFVLNGGIFAAANTHSCECARTPPYDEDVSRFLAVSRSFVATWNAMVAAASNEHAIIDQYMLALLRAHHLHYCLKMDTRKNFHQLPSSAVFGPWMWMWNGPLSADEWFRRAGVTAAEVASAK